MNDVILGGAIATISSVLTLIITKTLEYFQQKQEHIFYLKKEFFLKKINSYEKAVIYWNSISSSLLNLSTLISTLFKEGVSFSDDNYNFIVSDITKRVESISQSTIEMSASVDLYFDTTKIKSNNIVERFYTVQGEIQSIVNDINYGKRLFEKEHDNTIKRNIQMNINEDKAELEDKVEELRLLAVEIYEYYSFLINILRAEMSVYNISGQ